MHLGNMARARPALELLSVSELPPPQALRALLATLQMEGSVKLKFR